MRTTHKILLFLFAVCSAANAQVVPAATGVVRAGKNLQYAARYAETAEFTSNQSSWQTATGSGSVNYLNTNERHPFTADYTGGYTWTITGPDYQSGQFHHLFLSQGLNWRKWRFLAGDDASYLPQAPTTGFSGIPGIGEPIGVTNPNPVTGQSILTLNTHAVENNGTIGLEFNPRIETGFSVGGSSGLLRYPKGDGLDTNDESGNASLVHSFDARNALSATYTYSNFSYPGYNVSFETNTGLVGYQRKWSRNLVTNLSAGPMYISSSVSSIVPDSMDVAANASVTYLLRFTSASASYTRGTNGGGGYLFGAVVDTATGNFTKQFGINLTIGLTGGYQRTDALTAGTSTDGAFGGAEGTYQLTKNLIVFANYTGIEQSSTTPLPTNALNQLMNTIGFGIGFSPRQAHPRQQ
jgi:hypothetical protein